MKSKVKGICCPKCSNKEFKILNEKSNSFGVLQYRQCDKMDCARKYKVQIYQNKSFVS